MMDIIIIRKCLYSLIMLITQAGPSFAALSQIGTYDLTTRSSLNQVSCSFDLGMCGWKQDSTDHFDWLRHHGVTYSSNTGPSGDHSGIGYYVYIETSGRITGDKARLISPQITPNEQGLSCFSFWYHMYGNGVGRLNVYIQSGSSMPSSSIWYKSGNQSNQWFEANIPISATNPFNIIIEGIRGNTRHGDIAIDDVAHTDGSCGSQLAVSTIPSVNVSKSADKAILGNNTFIVSCEYGMPLQAQLYAVELQRKRKNVSNFTTIVTFQKQTNQINITYNDTSLESRTEGIKPTDNNFTAGLEFRNVDCSDEAEYKCKVYYFDGTNNTVKCMENTADLVVKANPLFSQLSRISYFPNTNITEGEEVVFTCDGDVGHEPVGDIAWFYYLDNDTSNSVDATVYASSTAPIYKEISCSYTRTSVLRLNMTKDLNNVVVRCTLQQNVYNQFGDGFVQTNKIPVHIYYSPKIDTIANKTHIEGLGTLTLRCTADSYPAPNYIWLLPDGSESLGSRLELTDLTVENSGIYTCIAYNTFKGENHTTNATTYIHIVKAPTKIPEPSATTPSMIQTTSAYYSLNDAIEVVCTNYHWYITVDMDKLRHIYPTAKVSDIYLGENKCTGVENSGLLIFQHDLSECLTSKLFADGSKVYNNELIYAEHDPVYVFIVLHYNWTVGVECHVGQNGTAIGGFPSNVTDVMSANASSRKYPVNISFYHDQDFVNEIGKGNPLRAKIGEHVYVKVFTTVTDWDIRMRVHTCYTKPTENARDHMKYFLIKNGCEVNTNTHIISQSTHETRFVFDSFEYSNSHDGIYMFCDALFCDSSDWSAQCRQTCNPV